MADMIYTEALGHFSNMREYESHNHIADGAYPACNFCGIHDCMTFSKSSMSARVVLTKTFVYI